MLQLQLRLQLEMTTFRSNAYDDDDDVMLFRKERFSCEFSPPFFDSVG